MSVIPRLSQRKPLAWKSAVLANGNMHPTALSEPQFSAAFRRERRRTERSGKPFLLMLAGLEAISANGNSRARLENLASALAGASRETDIVGWHRQGEVLGAIFTELGAHDRTVILAAVKQKVSAVLNKALAGRDVREIDLNFHFFPEDFRHDGHSELSLREDLYGEQQSKTVARGLKRVIDVAGSALALAVLAPVLLAISLLIKITSKGPVLFRQARIGLHGKKFTFLKFRSMYVNSDATLHKEYVSDFIAGKAPMKLSADGRTSAYKVIDDPRVTPLGRFLRRSSIDELPQLLNVLKGEMSLVGPRPPLPYEFAGYAVWHLRRIVEVKPGITGLWQVHGRSRTSFDEMVRLDLRYATSWSLWLDFVILLRTPAVVLSGDGAY